MSDELVEGASLNDREPRLRELQELLALPEDELYRQADRQYYVDDFNRKDPASRYFDEVVPRLGRLIESRDREVREEAARIWGEQIIANEGRVEQENLLIALEQEININRDPDIKQTAIETLKKAVVDLRDKPAYSLAMRSIGTVITMDRHLKSQDREDLNKFAMNEQFEEFDRKGITSFTKRVPVDYLEQFGKFNDLEAQHKPQPFYEGPLRFQPDPKFVREPIQGEHMLSEPGSGESSRTRYVGAKTGKVYAEHPNHPNKK